MGKPLSRPDCLRRNPTCLGKGDDEDGYIEDCYVPQRSIYDTMRINEQIDQGPKSSQTSKGTIDRAEASTLSSNGTLEASNLLEAKAPEVKKLDERLIFDALKLSSDPVKSAPAPPKRKSIPERKENVNRRSWKCFMPPNFPEFAERMEASLSEVSEAGVSNPSLQERGESSPLLTGTSSCALHIESMTESVTLEHVAKPTSVFDVQKAPQKVSDECLRVYSMRYQDEYSDGDQQPLLEEEHSLVVTTFMPEDQRLPSATWPRVLKGVISSGLCEGRQETCKIVLEDSLPEMAPLSPCLSEELLDTGLNILITPNLREKTFSELRFEEDERRIMMEAEDEWEEDSLSERTNCCLANISEEGEQIHTAHMMKDVNVFTSALVEAHSVGGRERSAHSGLDKSCSSSFTQDTHLEYDCSFSDSLAYVFTYSEPCDHATLHEQDSDADSEQMFLELEKQCLDEDEEVAGESRDFVPEETDLKQHPLTVAYGALPGMPANTDVCSAPLEPSSTDSAFVSDVEDFDMSGQWELSASQRGSVQSKEAPSSCSILTFATSVRESTQNSVSGAQDERGLVTIDLSNCTTVLGVPKEHSGMQACQSTPPTFTDLQEALCTVLTDQGPGMQEENLVPTHQNQHIPSKVGAVAPEVGAVAPEVGAVAPEVGAVAPEVGAVGAPVVGAVGAPVVGAVGTEVDAVGAEMNVIPDTSCQQLLRDQELSKQGFDDSPLSKSIKEVILKECTNEPLSSVNIEHVNISCAHPMELVFIEDVNFPVVKVTVKGKQQEDLCSKTVKSPAGLAAFLELDVAELGSVHRGTCSIRESTHSIDDHQQTSPSQDISKQASETPMDIHADDEEESGHFHKTVTFITAENNTQHEATISARSGGECISLGGSTSSHSTVSLLDWSCVSSSFDSIALVPAAKLGVPLDAETAVQVLSSPVHYTNEKSLKEWGFTKENKVDDQSEETTSMTIPAQFPPLQAMANKFYSTKAVEMQPPAIQSIAEQSLTTQTITEQSIAAQATTEQPPTPWTITEEPLLSEAVPGTTLMETSKTEDENIKDSLAGLPALFVLSAVSTIEHCLKTNQSLHVASKVEATDDVSLPVTQLFLGSSSLTESSLSELLDREKTVCVALDTELPPPFSADSKQPPLSPTRHLSPPPDTKQTPFVTTDTERSLCVTPNREPPPSVSLDAELLPALPPHTEQSSSVPLSAEQPLPVPPYKESPLLIPMNNENSMFTLPYKEPFPSMLQSTECSPSITPDLEQHSYLLLDTEHPPFVPPSQQSPFIPPDVEPPPYVSLNNECKPSAPLDTEDALPVLLEVEPPPSVPLNKECQPFLPLDIEGTSSVPMDLAQVSFLPSNAEQTCVVPFKEHVRKENLASRPSKNIQATVNSTSMQYGARELCVPAPISEVPPLVTLSSERLPPTVVSLEGPAVLKTSLKGPPLATHITGSSLKQPLVTQKSSFTLCNLEEPIYSSELPSTALSADDSKFAATPEELISRKPRLFVHSGSNEGQFSIALILDGPPSPLASSIPRLEELPVPSTPEMPLMVTHSLDEPEVTSQNTVRPPMVGYCLDGPPLASDSLDISSTVTPSTERPMEVHSLDGPPVWKCKEEQPSNTAGSLEQVPNPAHSIEQPQIVALKLEQHPFSTRKPPSRENSLNQHTITAVIPNLPSNSNHNPGVSSITAHTLDRLPVESSDMQSPLAAMPICEKQMMPVSSLTRPLVADPALKRPFVTVVEYCQTQPILDPAAELCVDNEAFQKERVEPLQSRLQLVNGLGQGLIQSAEKSSDVHSLEHDTEELSIQWNTLSKKVAERVAQLQEALLRCGKFQDALEPLLSWLTDTEELIANQKPPSAEYKVVKAQIQEQKLLQRLLDDRRATVEMIQAEGGRIAQSAEPADREKIHQQLESLEGQWTRLRGQATARKKQLDDILVLAQQFHESIEPISDWLSAMEKKLANSEPIGTQTSKIQQQITRHKILEEEVGSREEGVHLAMALGDSLSSLSSPADRSLLADRLASLLARYDEVRDRCGRKGLLLEQALVNARLFGEDEVEVLNWLGEVEDKLSLVTVKDYRRDVLHTQHALQLALNEDILCRKKNVDQAVKNGQALLKQTTGEEVLLIQEKLDGIKTRYSEITAVSAKALRTLEQARQLATKFQSTHEELKCWLLKVEEELTSSGGQSPLGEQIPQFQQRQKELKKEVMEQRLVLDTVNEVSSALLELVPWRAREGLDKLVSEANEQYRSVSDTIGQRVDQIDAAIQRSQQYEQAADAELAWVAETKRKLLALGPIRLEQDQTTAQLQVQKAFTIDIIRHKDSMDEILKQQDEILGACGEEHKANLQAKTQLLQQQYEEVSHLNSERYTGLERAQALVAQFWETHAELSPWLEETQSMIELLPPPAVDPDILRQQQEDMRLLRESIAEHKPHIDKLLKIGPQLQQLNAEEGLMVRDRYSSAENSYTRIREAVRQRAILLDEAVAQATQFHDKIEPMLETLEALSSKLQSAPLIPAEVDKIRECITENKNNLIELEKLQPSFEALKQRGQELIGRSEGADKDPSVKAIQDNLDQMLFLWGDIRAHVEERELKFLDVLELAEKFWYDMAALLTTLKDTQDIIHDLESPGIDPSLIKQQVEAAEAIKEETDGLHEELEFIRILGTDLIFACGETEKPEVKKSIDEMNSAWENLNRTWKDRLDRLEEAMLSAVQYQDSLQAMFDWLDNAVIKLCDMSPVGTDLDTVKDQLNEMKVFKLEVYQQQIEMERLSHQGELMLKKATDQTDRDIIKDPLTELRHLWDNLGEKINDRQHTLEAALLALGQFQHALAEVMSWLVHTEELVNSQRPISGDPKLIEVELAKHHVLKNDVLAHQNTVETVSDAGKELLQSSAGDDASSLHNRLQVLNDCWASVLQKTEEREQQLELALHQAQGFYGEIEDILQWLIRTESVLSSSKAIGGMPETAREQLAAHMDLYAEFKKTEEMYRQLLDKGRLMLPSREDQASESSSEQNVAILERKWQTVSTKMDERKSKLEEALTMACDFQNSLQDFINWLTQAEQNLNMAPPASLILDTVLFQIDEHKVFVNEVNQHRDHIIELDKTGNQLKFLSQKQDVVLIKNLLVSVQTRWEKVVQRSVDRGRALDDARKRAKQFHEAWKKLIDWLEDAENRLDTDVEISNDPDKIKLQLTKHKEFQKTLGSKQPVYDTTIRTGRAIKEKAQLADDVQKLDHLLGEVRDRWDTVCGKSVERQHKLEEALLFSGQFLDALQALVDWLYKVEPQLAEDQPVHGDLDLVMNLMDVHKGFQKELGKRTSSVQALKRSARELLDTSRDDIAWVKVQLQELSIRWDTVCKLSVSKQTRLESALKQAEEFRAAVHVLLEWLSEAEQTLRFRGSLPDDVEALQSLIDLHKEFMQKVEEKRVDVNTATGLGEAILAVCHPDCVTTIKHWNTIIRARFEEVLTWAKQHQQRLETAHAELVANADLLEELLAWIQWAETTLMQRDQDPIPQNIDQVKALISEHQLFMEEMTQKQPDVDKITKTYKRKTTEPEKARSNRKSLSQVPPLAMPLLSQSDTKNPRINQLSAHWQQVWLLALERQRKLNDVLDRLEELKEFANFDFDVWRKKYMRWMNHKKSRVMDFFRRIDKDQDGKITRQEFIDGILASKFPTTKLEMTAVADIFDRDGDGYIDYYEFVAALHPNKDAYRPTTDADKIEDEVTRQVAQCKCAKRFQVEQIGENKYRFFLGNQFGDSQQLRLVRILRSTVMVRVGGGWMALDEFLVKNDPCRARGRTNLELREKFILPEGASQGMTPFRSRGRRSKPSSRTASPTRSSSSASQSNHSCTSMPSSPATPASGAKTPLQPFRSYEKPWLANSKAGTPARGSEFSDFQMPSEVTPQSAKLKRPTFHSSRTSLTGEAACCASPVSSSAKPSRTDPKKTTSRPASCTGSRAGSRAGSRGSSRRGSDASDFDLLETQSACSDTSESSAQGGHSSSRRGATKPSKIPTMSKKSTTVTPPKTPGTKR